MEPHREINQAIRDVMSGAIGGLVATIMSTGAELVVRTILVFALIISVAILYVVSRWSEEENLPAFIERWKGGQPERTSYDWTDNRAS